MVRAAVRSRSHQQAAEQLADDFEFEFDPKSLERACDLIGGERVAERDAAAAVFADLPLVEREQAPNPAAAPDAVAVSVDGGRIQMRPDALPAADDGKTLWRESQQADLCTMWTAPQPHAADPFPQPPPKLLQLASAGALVAEFKRVKQPEPRPRKPKEQSQAPPVPPRLKKAPPPHPDKPRRLARAVVATRLSSHEQFALLVAAAAHARNFFGARLKAFLGDGAAGNWTIHAKHFADFVAILDFVHALAYLYELCTAGRPLDAATADWPRWLTAMWQGRIVELLPELRARVAALGAAPADAPASDPRQVAARAAGYLERHAAKMRYDEYRRQGLPIGSGWIESTVKQVGQRVKGSEKFWSGSGAEAMLQLRADHLGDPATLENFFARRTRRLQAGPLPA